MNLKTINLKNLVKGKKTYPSWTTSSIYELKTKDNEKSIIIYYIIKGGRKISRVFPRKISLTPSFCYVLGLIKGEGSNALGKSSYRRFTITNSDPKIIDIVLKELEKNSLFYKSNIIDKSVHLLHHTENDDKVIEYWCNQLNLPKSRFKCFNEERKTSPFGVCHVYISDVLLRRIVNLLQEQISSEN